VSICDGLFPGHIPSNAAERNVRFLIVKGPIENGVKSLDSFVNEKMFDKKPKNSINFNHIRQLRSIKKATD
jgi:hypothetical protein